MGASQIMTMLPSTPQVESVYLDPKHGILAGIPAEGDALSVESASNDDLAARSDSPFTVEQISSSTTMSPASSAVTKHPDVPLGGGPHTLLIDGTTLDPTAAIRIAQTVQDVAKGGAVMLDAPVSGGRSDSS